MIPELSVIKCLLDYNTWETYKDVLSVKDLSKEVHPFFSALDSFHQQNVSKESLSTGDLANLVLATSHKDKEYNVGVLEQLEKLSVSPATTAILIQSILSNKALKAISLAAYDVTEGRMDPAKLKEMFQDFLGQEEVIEDGEEGDFLVNDLDAVVNKVIRTPGLQWRLTTMRRMLGSLRKGNFGFIFARPECISGDSIIRVKYNKNSNSSRKYTIASFYKLFNGNHHLKGMGQQIQATTPEGKIYYTDIEHVTYSGKKPVYLVRTRRGFSLKATADHEFLLANGEYQQLCDLFPGSEIRSDRTQRQQRKDRPERSGSWPGSPYPTRMVGSRGPYNRAKEHRLVYDAHLNGLDLEEFIVCLESGQTHGFKYSDPSLDIHHVDMDHKNNKPSNLVLISRKDHTAIHAEGKDIGNQHHADVDWIESISYVGEEDVYDLGVVGENKNFKANGIFIHNCGKTTFLASEVTYMAEQLTEEDGPILWLNNEQQGEEVLLRLYQASIGCSTVQLLADIPRAQDLYMKKTHDKLKLVDRGHLHKKFVEHLCKKYKPSLVVIDQMDAVQGFDADRKDLQLGEIYRWGRELAKQYCPVIAVCQSDGTGEGVKWLTMSHVADAKTAKQAHPDWILGIGKQGLEGYESIRYLHLSKNKLHGDQGITDPDLKHGKIEVLIEAHIGRYKDI